MMKNLPSLSLSKSLSATRCVLACCLAGAVLAGCARASDPLGTNDPIEPFNRKVHAFNQSIDEIALRPAALSTKGNGEVAERIGDFADHLGKPADIVNNILQLRLIKATENVMRFGVNTIFGLGGLFDVATAAGMPANETDFGETLHIWGVGEGAYLEVPFIGPSTERDLVGTVVDLLIDPLNGLNKDQALAAAGVKIASRIGDRGRYSDTVDSILYDSADSYAQARLLYLQSRRHELGQDTGESSFVDPYEDPYAQ